MNLIFFILSVSMKIAFLPENTIYQSLLPKQIYQITNLILEGGYEA